MRRLSWATPPFHTVFAVHLNNFTKCSVSCFVFTRAPKNANLSTVKNIAIFTHFFLKYHSAKVVVCCQLNLWVTDWWTLWADWVRRHKRFEQEMFLKPSVEWRNTGQYWRGGGNSTDILQVSWMIQEKNIKAANPVHNTQNTFIPTYEAETHRVKHLL